MHGLNPEEGKDERSAVVIDSRPFKLSRNVGNLSELQSPSPGGGGQTRIAGDLVNFYFVVPLKTLTKIHSWEF